MCVGVCILSCLCANEYMLVGGLTLCVSKHVSHAVNPLFVVSSPLVFQVLGLLKAGILFFRHMFVCSFLSKPSPIIVLHCIALVSQSLSQCSLKGNA